MSRLAALAVVVAAAALATGCGVQADPSPRAIPRDEVPFGLLTASPSEDTGSRPASRAHQVFFVHDTRLEGVSRALALTSVTDLIGALLAGPSSSDVAAGLRTAVPAGTALRGATRDGSTVTLDLSDALLQVRGQEQTLAIAQIVFTSTAAPGVRFVRLRLDGQPLQVPRGDGTLSDTVSRGDYRVLAPSR